MKINTKDLQKALDWLRKNAGDPADIEIDFDFQHQFRISSYTDLAGQVKIIIYETECTMMPNITKTERL